MVIVVANFCVYLIEGMNSNMYQVLAVTIECLYLSVTATISIYQRFLIL